MAQLFQSHYVTTHTAQNWVMLKCQKLR